MATRSSISLENADGTILQIYCHFDGYPQGVGKMLEDNYTDLDKVKALISLGSVSVLASSIECPEGHSFDNPVKGHTIFYGRDRGEKDQEAGLFVSYNDWKLCGDMQAYNYIFRHESQTWSML